MPTTNTHKLFDAQPTTSVALLSTQLMITAMVPGSTSAAFTPNLPSSDAKALSLFLSHSFTPFSSLGGGGDAAVPPPPGSNASMSTLIAIPIAMSSNHLFEAHNLVHKITFEEIYTLLSGLQFIIQLGDSLHQSSSMPSL